MGLFKKKNQQQTETEVKDPNEGIKESILAALNSKLNGTIYDNCIIMPKGFTIDVQIGRREEKDDIKLLQAIFIVKNDEFDEPLIDPVDAQGKTENEVAQMAADIFFAGVWHPLDQSIQKRNPIRISVDYLRQHYDFDLFCQSVVRIGVKDKQPVMLMSFIKDEIPKFLGSKKYYWIRINLAKFKDKKNIEIRINGSVCPTLSRFFDEYVDSWEENEGFTCEKQYAICVQREDDKCPFNKDLVMECARFAIGKMENISSREEYIDMAKQLEEMAADKNLASEIRIFIPEIMAKLTLGYREGDSLFFLEGDGEEQTKIEFKKTQLRSYFYLQQAVLEYLSSRPDNDKVTRIVTNSVAFREMKKAVDAGHKPEELFVPGTSYRISDADYKVW